MESSATDHDPRRLALEEALWMARRAVAPRLRTMSGFAEQEVVVPKGPRKGPLDLSTQPWLRLYLAEIDSGRWTEFNLTGGRQGGKTLGGSAIPLMYHLFEIGEDVIYALPDMKLANHKWSKELKPVLAKSRYWELLPRAGAGSRGGDVNEIEFLNGANLIFMTGGGGDAGRAGRTARVVVVTEADKFDEAGGESQETDKINQILHCTDAYGSGRIIYSECTLTVKDGRTWREYEAGSASRMVLHCPLCGAWVTPEREHLTGWEEAEDEMDARAGARWNCPACAGAWDEGARRAANMGAVLAHRGQTVDADGLVVGPAPRTMTLGFRWSAVNNLFLTAGDVAVRMWRHAREENELKKELLEREVCQYLWATPYEPKSFQDKEAVTFQGLAHRTINLKRGEVPEWAAYLTIGCDVGQDLCHWTAIAWDAEANGHVVDYGVIEVHTASMGVQRAVAAALRGWRDTTIPERFKRAPDVVCVDARFRPDEVKDFCAAGAVGPTRWFSTMGYGSMQRHRYAHPKSNTGTVVSIGDNYHAVRDMKYRVVNVNVDHWKTFWQDRIIVPIGAPGHVTIYQPERRGEHNSWIKHQLAERQVKRFMANTGEQIVWRKERENAPNHWWDASVLGCVAGHIAGVRLVKEKEAPQKRRLVCDYPSASNEEKPWIIGRQ